MNRFASLAMVIPVSLILSPRTAVGADTDDPFFSSVSPPPLTVAVRNNQFEITGHGGNAIAVEMAANLEGPIRWTVQSFIPSPPEPLTLSVAMDGSKKFYDFAGQPATHP